MNTLPAALSGSASADSSAHASHTSTNSRTKQSGDSSFDDMMGNALDSQSEGAATPQNTPIAPTTTDATDAAAFTADVLNTDNTEAAPVDPEALLAAAVSSQVVLALADQATAAATTPAPTAATNPIPSTDTVDSTQGNAIGNAPPVLTTENDAQTLSPELMIATTAATTTRASAVQSEVATVVAQSNTQSTAKAVAATVPEEAPAPSESSTAETEKNAVASGEVSIKIPVSTTTTTATPQKGTAQKSARSGANAAQSTAVQQDTTTSTVLDNLAVVASAVKATSSGTNRALEQPMQTLRDVWSNSAYRALSLGTESTTTTEAATVTTETITLSSNEQFAEAVQNALNTPRELLPRRVEIQLNTPPGATVTLSLTRVNGELRAQFGANNMQALQWLNSEIHDLQNMNFGLAVLWSPPQLATQQQQETRTERDRQEQRRREGTRRVNQPGMDAVTGLSSRLGAATSMKG